MGRLKSLQICHGSIDPRATCHIQAVLSSFRERKKVRSFLKKEVCIDMQTAGNPTHFAVKRVLCTMKNFVLPDARSPTAGRDSRKLYEKATVTLFFELFMMISISQHLRYILRQESQLVCRLRGHRPLSSDGISKSWKVW